MHLGTPRDRDLVQLSKKTYVEKKYIFFRGYHIRVGDNTISRAGEGVVGFGYDLNPAVFYSFTVLASVPSPCGPLMQSQEQEAPCASGLEGAHQQAPPPALGPEPFGSLGRRPGPTPKIGGDPRTTCSGPSGTHGSSEGARIISEGGRHRTKDRNCFLTFSSPRFEQRVCYVV